MSRDSDNSDNLFPNPCKKSSVQENIEAAGFLCKISSEDTACSSRPIFFKPRVESNVVRRFKKSVPKIKKFTSEKRRRKSQIQKKVLISQPLSVVVSFRCGKLSRTNKSQKSAVKLKKVCEAKKFKTLPKEKCWEKRIETPKMGKRGRLGGKAKGKPPVEESSYVNESDEESENFYFYKISLGQYQQPEDGSGASTSNKQEDSGFCTQKESEEFEEKELLELQRWGMSYNF